MVEIVTGHQIVSYCTLIFLADVFFPKQHNKVHKSLHWPKQGQSAE